MAHHLQPGGLCCRLGSIPVLGHIAEVVLGHVARREIARSGGAQGGDRLALARLMVGRAGVASYVLSILGVLAFLGLGIGWGLYALLPTEGGFDGVALLRML